MKKKLKNQPLMNASETEAYLKNLDLDLYQLTWDLTSQVPKGRVTTYGALARALGDIRAARAVGAMEHANPRPIVMPCHRVVYADGGIGGYGAPEGVEKKVRLLESEGVHVKDGKIIDFDKVLFTDFDLPDPPPLEVLRGEQQKLRNKIKLKDRISFDRIRTVAGVDVSYDGMDSFGAAVVLGINNLEVLEKVTVRKESRFPYIPTYLSYHELPIAIELLAKLTNRPDIVLFDGNGVLHPNGLGLAAHAGVLMDTPTMGIAKKLLCGELSQKPDHGENVYEVHLNDKLIGYGYKPPGAKTRFVYISPGDNMGFGTSLKLAKILCRTRVPEPIRIAHDLALEKRKMSKKK